MSDKKKQQLGMHPSTASNRLVKDLLFHFITEQGKVCHHCGEPMTRDDFTIEHIKPWLDSEDPLKLFFDLTNIAFSHLKCNIKAGRNHNKIKGTTCPSHKAYDKGCRCEKCRALKKKKNKKYRKK